MRRFTQTFVLALQSPKKYYVHNDIFRYQDEIITDEDCDGDMRGEVAEERLDRQVLGEAQGLTQPIAPAPRELPYLHYRLNHQLSYHINLYTYYLLNPKLVNYPKLLL
ncbi:hypothetical protein YQE_01100, partial [Dendroctonus ponderosae]